MEKTDIVSKTFDKLKLAKELSDADCVMIYIRQPQNTLKSGWTIWNNGSGKNSYDKNSIAFIMEYVKSEDIPYLCIYESSHVLGQTFWTVESSNLANVSTIGKITFTDAVELCNEEKWTV